MSDLNYRIFLNIRRSEIWYCFLNGKIFFLSHRCICWPSGLFSSYGKFLTTSLQLLQLVSVRECDKCYQKFKESPKNQLLIWPYRYKLYKLLASKQFHKAGLCLPLASWETLLSSASETETACSWSHSGIISITSVFLSFIFVMLTDWKNE